LEDLNNDIENMSSKISLMTYIFQYADDLFVKNKLNENKYFDEKVFYDTLAVTSQYYQIDPSLSMLFDKRQPSRFSSKAKM